MQTLAIIAIILSVASACYAAYVIKKQRDWHEKKVLPELASTRQAIRDWEEEHGKALLVAANLAQSNNEVALRLLEALERPAPPSSSVLPLYSETSVAPLNVPKVDLDFSGS